MPTSRPARLSVIIRILLLPLLSSWLGGCLSMPGPSEAYPATKEQVRGEWTRMKSNPAALERPLVVLDGWTATGGGETIARELRALTGASKDEVRLEKFGLGETPEAAAGRVIRHVDATWPSDDPEWTTEVDVVGFSNGGVYARLAALPPRKADAEARKRLRIKRLYTISTPHRGTRPGLGALGIDACVRAVQPGSDFLAYLDENLPDAGYELTCYAEVNDEIVGAKNTAPPGQEPIWTGTTHLMSHISSSGNQRILADIALRLRGEEPLAGEPSAPPKH